MEYKDNNYYKFCLNGITRHYFDGPRIVNLAHAAVESTTEEDRKMREYTASITKYLRR